MNKHWSDFPTLSYGLLTDLHDDEQGSEPTGLLVLLDLERGNDSFE